MGWYTFCDDASQTERVICVSPRIIEQGHVAMQGSGIAVQVDAAERCALSLNPLSQAACR